MSYSVAQDTRSHSNTRQVYLHTANGIDPHFGDDLNLDNVPHTPVGDNGGSSPKLISSDSAFSDPGLSSPYVGPQRHLAKLQALGLETGLADDRDTLTMLSSMPSRPSSPALQTHISDVNEVKDSNEGLTTLEVSSKPDYNPMIAIMIISSLGALVLLGLVAAVVYVSQLLRFTVLRGYVWRTVIKGNKKDSFNIPKSDALRVPPSNLKKLIAEESFDEKNPLALSKQSLSAPPENHPSDIMSEKASLGIDEDPEVPTIPSSTLALHESPVNNSLTYRRAVLAWTYDNWLTHFMFALFGWMGVLLGRSAPSS